MMCIYVYIYIYINSPEAGLGKEGALIPIKDCQQKGVHPNPHLFKNTPPPPRITDNNPYISHNTRKTIKYFFFFFGGGGGGFLSNSIRGKIPSCRLLKG